MLSANFKANVFRFSEKRRAIGFKKYFKTKQKTELETGDYRNMKNSSK